MTWVDAHSDTHIPHGFGLSARDKAVVELVGRFGQLEAGQIGACCFAGLASKTPLDRTLKRLVDGRYLARLSRSVGGNGGGSGSYVYQLGRAGWRLLGRTGAYWAPRAVSAHTLAIADCYTALCEQEQAGALVLLAFEVEPDCHRRVEQVHLTPDAYTEVGFRDRGVKVAAWLEVDRATEHANVIQAKCVRYWKAYQAWAGDVFPYVLFVVPDEQRGRAIERVISGGPDEAQPLFQVCIMSAFSEVIHSFA
jgi:hypothetical protein